MTSSFCRSVTCMVCAALVLVGGSVVAADSTMRVGPKSFDFGFVPVDAKVYGHYWLVNDGTDSIHIQEVKPQCGCTAAPLTRDHIAPSDSLYLEIAFNSKGMHGWVHKRIDVFYNDTAASPAQLYFSAKVGETTGDIVVHPVDVHFDDFDKVKEDIVLENTGQDTYAIDVATPPPPYIDYGFDRDSIPPGERALMTVHLGDSTPLGLYQTSMTLLLDGPIPHTISIPIKGTGYVR
ncbi:MAG: DUF1573 domain-containing protein [candidate division Zixibacteria bacterium]|nr:DUF1573 domain-containing protein [candidate division Zixibacteria bacterium]